MYILTCNEVNIDLVADVISYYLGVGDWYLFDADPSTATHRNHRGQLAETPAQACVVIYGAPTKTECVSRTRTWRGGQNHLILDLHDQSR